MKLPFFPKNYGQTNRLVISAMIQSIAPKMIIEQVSNGKLALEAYIKSPDYDLILMDIGLPGISGVDCFKLLRKKLGFDKVPVLAFTASVMPDEIKKITDTGFSGLIEKPIRVSTFLSAINDALEVK